MKLSVSMLDSENRASADAFAAVLGDIAAASRSQAAKTAVSSRY